MTYYARPESLYSLLVYSTPLYTNLHNTMSGSYVLIPYVQAHEAHSLVSPLLPIRLAHRVGRAHLELRLRLEGPDGRVLWDMPLAQVSFPLTQRVMSRYTVDSLSEQTMAHMEEAYQELLDLGEVCLPVDDSFTGGDVDTGLVAAYQEVEGEGELSLKLQGEGFLTFSPFQAPCTLQDLEIFMTVYRTGVRSWIQANWSE